MFGLQQMPCIVSLLGANPEGTKTRLTGIGKQTALSRRIANSTRLLACVSLTSYNALLDNHGIPRLRARFVSTPYCTEDL